MARADPVTEGRQSLYERDFCLWVEEQARLLRQGTLERLDVVNLVDEIEDLGIGAKKAVKSNLVVVLLHLLKHQFQPRRRSRSWRASILEHRQRLGTICAPAPASGGMRETCSRRLTPTPGPVPGWKPACRSGRSRSNRPTRLSRLSTPSFCRTRRRSPAAGVG